MAGFPQMSYFDPVMFGIELGFTLVAVVFCFLIYFKTKEIYELTKGKYLLDEIFNRLRSSKEAKGWSQRITLTDWGRIGEGHALLIHPDGNVVASPIFSGDKAIEHIGNLHREDLRQLWERYQHKEEHFKKYLEKSLYVC